MILCNSIEEAQTMYQKAGELEWHVRKVHWGTSYQSWIDNTRGIPFWINNIREGVWELEEPFGQYPTLEAAKAGAVKRIRENIYVLFSEVQEHIQ